MTFRFRAFFSYTLPGVLALIGWWWFFARKKQQINSHDGQASTNVYSQQTETTKTEPTDDLNCMKAQPVFRDQEKCQGNDDLCTKSTVEVIPLSEMQQPLRSLVANFSSPAESTEANINEPNDKYEETWKMVHGTSSTIQENNYPLATSIKHHSFSLPRLESHSQEIQVADMLIPVTESEEKLNCSSSKVKTKCEAKQVPNKVLVNKAMTIKCAKETSVEIDHMSAVYHKPEKEAVITLSFPCNQLVQTNQFNETDIASMQTGTHTTTSKMVVKQPAIVNEMLFIDKSSQTIEEKIVGRPEFSEIVEKNVQRSADETMTLHTEFCKNISLEKTHKIKAIALIEKGTQVATINRYIQHNKEVAMEKDTHVAAVEKKAFCLKESNDILSLEKDAQRVSLEKAQCNETEETVAVENESIVTGKLRNSYMECDYRENDGSEIGNPFSNYQGKANEYCEKMRFVVGNLGRETEDEGLVKEEAEKIEQVAVNIISKVILAATKEILSCATTDMSDNGKVLEHESDCLLEQTNDTLSASQKLVWEQNVVKSNRESEMDIKPNIVIKPTLSEEKKHAEGKDYVSILKNMNLSSPVHGDPAECKQKNLIQSEHREKFLSSVPGLGELFEELNIVTEDSGCSVCTSEDGIGSEDLLQSTGFSCIAANQHFDFLNTSRIGGVSMDQSTVPSEELLALGSQENNTNILCSNEIQKESSPEVRNDEHWSTETEADHSGGSDVNSMDSVDSGCAPGKTKNIQIDRQGTECKKSELVIWEIEVPKHLVGRLIGKQGRYVSFLKQTSGAKIYISTLPYTQEFQICHIEGSQQQVDRALNMIGKKFKELNLTNIYAPPPPLTLPSLPMTSWLMLPDGITVEVIVVNVVNAGHIFVQQHTHPTFHALRSLDQQMYLCYSQPGIPTLPTPVEVGVICAAPGMDGAWWRAQVVAYYKDGNEAEIRYVDYGGYERVKIEILRQIRSDFVTLPFQGAEVLLDNVISLPDEDQFSSEADVAVNDMTRGTALLAQVTSYDGVTGLPLIQLWSMLGDEVVSINRALVERGFAQWIDNY
uniref:A-kinase anchor protein 1, mitochondrial n=1 Tax=Geotrypetes seraphini TaxID=260995 RepID=A0A6P8P1P7_GEOSA|nr:A-kinase anchor protein 1, mitochondrial [Geotrypetes seraphini]XP_033777464.1 A-kinase anchor protein 1, mitochondrial [Geotrypetes seraphini]XP_033777465.1 A-kinase anchor protein 1, mitochondrial [Geotrypetes seraphini]